MHFVNGKSTSKTQFVKNIYIIVCIIISIITKVKRKRCHRYCTLHSPQTWRNKQTETNRQTERKRERVRAGQSRKMGHRHSQAKRLWNIGKTILHHRSIGRSILNNKLELYTSCIPMRKHTIACFIASASVIAVDVVAFNSLHMG